MSTQRAVMLLLALVGIALGLVLWGGPVDEDERIRRVIRDIATAAEESNNHDILARVHADYSDSAGLTKKSLQGLLARQFLSHGPIVIAVGPIQVHREEEVAIASFDAVFVEGLEGLGLDGDARQFTVDLVLVDGDWLVIASDNGEVFQ